MDAASEDAEGLALLGDVPEDLEPTPYKLNFTQIVNYERLSRMIKDSAEVELVLRRTTIGSSGKKRSEKVRMITKIDTQVERSKAVQVAHKLYDKVVKESDETAGMAELESLAPGDVSGLEFNDGYIKLDDGSCTPKKIGIDTVDRYFEYPVGSSTQLPARKWEQAVASEVVSLQGLLGVELDVS